VSVFVILIFIEDDVELPFVSVTVIVLVSVLFPNE